jgi:predicted nucleic acid-binding protein
VTGWLLDVNVVCGCAWKTHADHDALLGWLLQQDNWATCPIVELGFVRISMTAAYEASFGDAQQSLATLRASEVTVLSPTIFMRACFQS